MSLFAEGKFFNKASAESGGGGDQHNLGWYATPTALRTAHPTALDGDWAIVGSTDTVWVWDSDLSDWKDTDSKAEVTLDMIIVKSETMPSPSTVPANAIYMYTGLSNASYTTNYIYKNIKTTTYTDSVTFQPATLSGTVVTATAGALAGLCAEYITGDITTITSGTMTFDSSSDLWVFVGKDADNNTVGSFQVYQEDYETAGFTFTGTPQDGDVVAFACAITEASVSYAWTRIDVQPAPEGLPSQTGQSGKFLTTDGTDASWSDKPLVNNTTGTDSVMTGLASGSAPNSIVITSQQYNYNSSNGKSVILIPKKHTNGFPSSEEVVAIGSNVYASGSKSVIIGPNAYGSSSSVTAIGYNATAIGQSSIAIGAAATCAYGATRAIQIGSTGSTTTNNDANTLKVANTNGNFELMSADGTIPAARLKNAATSPATMPTLAVADWSSNTQTVTVTGVTATNTIFVSPAPSSAADYAAAGIVCTAQGTDSLTFTCQTTPTNNLTVNVVIMGA